MTASDLFAALAGLAGATAAGHCLARFALDDLLRRERMAWGVAAGTLCLAAASAGLMAAGLAPGPKKFGAILAALALLSYVVRRHGRTPLPPARAEGSSILPPVLHAATVLAVLLFAAEAVRGGMGAADFFAIWGLKAKTIFSTGAIPARLFHDPALAASHPEYPLLVPLSLSSLAAAMRSWNGNALALWYPFWALATVLAVSGFLARRVSRLAGAAGGLLVALCAPLYGPGNGGTADIPLALGIVLLSTAFLDVIERETAGACARMFLAALFCAATRPEGTLFVLLLLATLVVRRFAGRPVPRLGAFALLFAVGAQASAMRLFRGPVDGTGAGGSLGSLGGWERAVLQVVGVEALAAALPVAAIGLLLVVTRPGPGDPAIFPLALQALACGALCAFSSGPLWAAQESFGRLALTLFPAAALVAAGRAFPSPASWRTPLPEFRRHRAPAAAAVGLLLLALVLIPEAIRGAVGEKRMDARLPLARPTFHASVEPILQAHCQTCHRPDGIAPVALTTYDDADQQSRTIRRQATTRAMPPWKAGESCGAFANDPSLSEREITTIVRWVDTGSPEGDPKDAPAPRHFVNGWQLGKPDLVLDAPEFTPDFSKGDVYQCFAIPTRLAQNAWVTAVEVKPGNRAMVHHALLYVEEGIASEKWDQAAPGPGYPCFGGPRAPVTDSFGEWAPGMQPRFYPPGTARFLPRQSRVIMQIHYSALFGSVAPDRSEIGVYFAKEPISKRLLSNDVRADAPFTIPAGAVSRTLRGKLGPLESGARLVAILPHMHLLGRTMKVTARLPDGKALCLVDVEDWDLRWQRTYYYANPVTLPKGTVLELAATFDNSYGNPNNPSDPLVDVHFGERTTDEMCMALLFWTVDGKNPGERDAFFRGEVCAPPPTPTPVAR